MIFPLVIIVYGLFSYPGHGVVQAAPALEKKFREFYEQDNWPSALPFFKQLLLEKKYPQFLNTKDLTRYVLGSGSKQLMGIAPQLITKGIPSGSREVSYFLMTRYYLERGDMSKAQQQLQKMSQAAAQNSALAAVSFYYGGVIEALQGNHPTSIKLFKRCAEAFTTSSHVAASLLEDQSPAVTFVAKYIYRQCQLGEARSLYADQQWPQSAQTFGKFDKKNFSWPLALKEEAWTYYQIGEFNRALGKVATYRAPQLRYAYVPEVDVLRASTFLSLCLYADAVRTVDSFYQTFAPLYDYMSGTLTQKSQSPQFFLGLLERSSELNSTQQGPFEDFINKMLKLPYVQAWRDRQLGNSAMTNEAIKDYEDLIAAGVKAEWKKYLFDLAESMKYMSYIKLEALGKNKQAVYENIDLEGKRGSLKNLKRGPHQYFWSFYREFWADELGDYVFSLPNKCLGDDREA